MGRWRDIKEVARTVQSSITALLETKIKTVQKIQWRTPYMWQQVNNLEVCNMARLWIMWDGRVWTGEVLHLSEQLIAVLFTNKGGLKFMYGAVYGHNDRRRRELLWQDIIHLSGAADVQLQLPLLLV